MTKFLLAVSVVVLCGIPAAAQSTPEVEWSLGYSFVRFNSSSDIPAFTAQGGSTSIAYNLNHWVGIVGDFGGYHNDQIGPAALDNTTYTYLFGPRFSYRRSGWIPFAQVLFGAAHTTGSVVGPVINPPPPGAPPGARLEATKNSFAMTVGAGIDIPITKGIALRPIQAEYLLTQLGGQLTGGGHQNNFRYTGGIVFRFGSK